MWIPWLSRVQTLRRFLQRLDGVAFDLRGEAGGGHGDADAVGVVEGHRHAVDADRVLLDRDGVSLVPALADLAAQRGGLVDGVVGEPVARRLAQIGLQLVRLQRLNTNSSSLRQVFERKPGAGLKGFVRMKM